jgi:PHD/YefM family antitoxin component YafN of YafNO toxin-antitoxin module
MSDPARLRVSNEELATVREAMRELGRLLDQLKEGHLEKVVLTQRNQMRAVLITVERYSELERDLASASARNGLRAAAETGTKRVPKQANLT